MRIAINALAMNGGGGEQYLLGVLPALCAVAPEHEFLVLLGPSHRELAQALPRRVRTLVCERLPSWAGLRMMWEQIVLPRMLRRCRADLLFAAYNTAVLLCDVPIVLLAHNCNPYSRVSVPWSRYGRTRNQALRLLGRLSARRAAAVVFVSHTSARVMAPLMRVPIERVHVVHHGWRPVVTADGLNRTALDLPRGYILSVSDLQPHKNTELLLMGFQQFVAESAYAGPLVIVGGEVNMSSAYARQLRKLREELPCRDRIRFVGRVSHSQMAAIYRQADLLVFPSLEETFGLPMLEGMGAGVPIVAADWRLSPDGEADRCNAAPEICGEAAEFFNPMDPNSLRDAMRRVLSDRRKRDELARLGPLRAKEFSWDRAAAELLAIFRESTIAAQGSS